MGGDGAVLSVLAMWSALVLTGMQGRFVLAEGATQFEQADW